MWDSLAVIVMGRHLFDLVNGWEGHPPAGDHVIVVSNRPKPEGWHLAAALVDEVAMDVVPVVFGSGKRYFGSIKGQHHLGSAASRT